jgi:FkbM family methyltransferase
LERLLKGKKILALDVGAQGGFNSDNFFPKKYNHFFEEILIEPIASEAEKLKDKKFIINKGLWSKKEKKKLHIMDNRLGSSSMYEPNKDNFDLHNINKKDFDKFSITRSIEVECDTITNQLAELNVKNLDYLKIDTQGSELEILKGIGNFRPLLIKLEAHIFSMYKNVPSWHLLINHLFELNYVLVDWKNIGNHNTRISAEADLIFIPNFNNEIGKSLLKINKEKFLSLMLIFGQLKLLQIIMKKLEINEEELEKLEDKYFY